MNSSKILIVEDEAIVAVDLKERLAALGYSVVATVSNGQSALQAAACHSPDLVLLDIVLKGDVDGIETAQALRDSHGIPVIYLTAYADNKTLERAKVTEPYAYLIKPIEERELRVAVEIALYKHSAEAELRRTQEQLRKRVAELQLSIAEKEAAQSEIKRLNSELELRVEKRTRELKEANKDLESFVYSVSHDLRAPLRAIHGFAEILQRRCAPQTPSQADGYLENILQASSQMGQLIEDLLAYSRLGKRAVRCQPVEFGPLLDRVAERLAGRIAERNATIEVPKHPPLLSGDSTLLSQILTNLLQNALTYCRPGQSPQIVVACRKERNGIRISVQDDGIGIEEGLREKIFNVFQRLHSQEDIAGSGIGLAIVKRAAELMNGSVEVESIAGQGSTFSLWLPQKGTAQGGHQKH